MQHNYGVLLYTTVPDHELTERRVVKVVLHHVYRSYEDAESEAMHAAARDAVCVVGYAIVEL
jgi:hypothetical protein